MKKLFAILCLTTNLVTPAAASPSLNDVYGPPDHPPGCRATYCPARPFAWVPPAPPAYFSFGFALPWFPPPVYYAPPPPPVYVPPPPPGPLGWVYGPYTYRDPSGAVWVSVGADGLNVHTAPNGPTVLALANGTPVVPLRHEGNWVEIAAGCALAPTYTYSVTAGGVPLSVCVA
jgi:hypothetical protein